jgi:hypothetical protein
MLRRMSWVEWLAIGLLVIACLLCSWGSSADPGGWGGVSAILYGALIAVVGFSLFLVRPVLRLGVRTPLWLIPVCGVLVFWFDDPVCQAFYPVGTHSDGLQSCRFNLPIVGIVMVLFGIILVVRQSQVVRKRRLGGNATPH